MNTHRGQPNLFRTFDFSMLESPDFKEDSVREVLVLPLLRALGYTDGGESRIVRSPTLQHPWVKTGTRQQRIKSIPDYLLTVEGKRAWILDAKAPDEKITDGKHLEQAYFYAIHPDVRVNLFALCNGREFALFHISQRNALLYFHLSEVSRHWKQTTSLLAPAAVGQQPSEVTIPAHARSKSFNYLSVSPPTEITDLKKQSARRHYGVHGYFTKQVWNVVQEYIKTFTQPGDVVLDPYGGSGVTLVEALILGRKAIHVDINPLSTFLVENLIAPVNTALVADAYAEIVHEFEHGAPRTGPQIQNALSEYDYPQGITLPGNSDVDTVEQLFSSQQLAQLAYLKHLIKRVDDVRVQGTLMLMFSGLLNQINLTYHASGTRSAGRGDSSMFRYYRYRIAPSPSMLDILERLDLRYRHVMKAKAELAPLITEDVFREAQIVQGSATSLDRIAAQTIDYVYTDPPYGAKIPYLDLSTMWNAWLDLPVSKVEFEQEVIEGGELEKSAEDYSSLLAQSIEEIYRVLKFDRWMSFVFAHKDPHFWHVIVEAAEKSGFEYAGSAKQDNNKTTFKKRQNPFTVLEGQLIINFKKVRNPRAIMRVELGAHMADIVVQTVEGVIAKNEGATLEEINNELIIKGLELGFLDILSREQFDLSAYLNEHFEYDSSSKRFQLPHNVQFRSQIDEEVRIRYYLISFLRRKQREGKDPTFDEIVLNTMPLLKNGRTPENQTILSVLERVAKQVGNGRWRIEEETGQLPLFDDF